MTGGPDRQAPQEDRAVRRALTAGGAVWAVVGGSLGISLAGRGGEASAAGVLAGLAAGSFVATLWLLVTWLLDLITRRPTPRRRLRWTYGVVALTFITPLLAMAAATQAG